MAAANRMSGMMPVIVIVTMVAAVVPASAPRMAAIPVWDDMRLMMKSREAPRARRRPKSFLRLVTDP
jgi:hypothetical protein